jgi:hypothetical protein
MAKPGPKPGSKRKPAQQETVAPVVAPDAEAPTAEQAPADPAAQTQPVVDASATDTAPAEGQAPTAEQAPPAGADLAAEEPAAPSASDRENPAKLHGQALRDLAHKRGIALSTLCFMSDAKIREQLLYINYRQYDDAVD